jgi:hypothetical protein
MRVERILRLILATCRSVHAARIAALAAAVAAVIRGGRLTLTGLGRAYGGATSPKHSIKRADRLVGNPHLWAERLTILRALALYLVRGVARPVVLIDWTGAGLGEDKYALVAAIPVAGRAIPILFEVHPKRHYCSPKVERRFLKRLATVLPTRSCPIIVADAGFRMPFIRAVEDLGWGYVIRVRGSKRRLTPQRIPIADVFSMAKSTPQDLGDSVLNRSDWHKRDCPRAILGTRPKRSSARSTEHYRLSALEPWLLATNLWNHSPEQIVALYRARMTIEECFRDTTSRRCGWGFDYARSRDVSRLETLLLVGALATFVVMTTGLAAEANGIHRRFQANTISNRRVLSVFQLGCAVLVIQNCGFAPQTTEIRSAVALLRAHLKRLSPTLANSSFWLRRRTALVEK